MNRREFVLAMAYPCPSNRQRVVRDVMRARKACEAVQARAVEEARAACRAGCPLDAQGRPVAGSVWRIFYDLAGGGL